MYMQKLSVKKLTLAGVMAALVWAYLEGLDLKQSALAGLAAGSIAMESSQTINPNMSEENLKSRMGL